jgi:hypothetical protein
MQLSFLLSAAIAFISGSVNADFTNDLSAYLIAHPEKHAISTCDLDFLEWIAPVSPGNTTASKSEVLVENAYIIQLRPGSGLTKRGETAHSLFHKRAVDIIDYDTRYEFTDTSLFFGLSIQVKDNANVTTLQEIPNVLKVWPIPIFPAPYAVNPPTGVYTWENGETFNVSATAGPNPNVNSPHKMTDVDRLHEEGIKGKFSCNHSVCTQS